MGKLLKLRRQDVCADCTTALAAGTDAYWYATERVVRCTGCADRAMGPTADATPRSEAGASAREQYGRRSAKERARKEKLISEDAEWRDSIRQQKPVVGRIMTALTPKPVMGSESQRTTAWKVGAEGEERVAEVLATVEGIEVLHDRRVPGSRANIDHIAIGPGGVFVIDAKKYKEGSPIELRDKGSFLRPDVRLFVGSRDCSNLVEGVRGQMAVVRSALGEELASVPVHGVLCFIGCVWGWRKKPKASNGVIAIWPLGLPGRVGRPGDHAASIAATAHRLRTILPPAGRA